jgi:hypothetical protein
MDIVFRLEASIRASRSLEDITDKVAGYLEEAKPLLRRGGTR